MIGSGYRMAVAAKRLMLAVALATLLGPVGAQQTSQQRAPTPSPLGEEITLDRVVAIVHGDLVLESDVELEQRFAAFQPFSEAGPVSRERLIDRLIDRALIVQQMALQPEPPITDAEVDAELNTLRKAIPSCASYHCETDAGWEKFIADHGFTMQELRDRWRLRMEVLRFIEERFRAGIFDTITPAQIDDYYKNTMMPAYQKEKMTPPPESSVADRIQEILLQEQVNKVLDDWLTALRAEGGVRILKVGEEAP